VDSEYSTGALGGAAPAARLRSLAAVRISIPPARNMSFQKWNNSVAADKYFASWLCL